MVGAAAGDMKIRTAARRHDTPSAKIKNGDTPNAGEAGKLGQPHAGGRDAKRGGHSGTQRGANKATCQTAAVPHWGPSQGNRPTFTRTDAPMGNTAALQKTGTGSTCDPQAPARHRHAGAPGGRSDGPRSPGPAGASGNCTDRRRQQKLVHCTVPPGSRP